jgi:hypothetical protein
MSKVKRNDLHSIKTQLTNQSVFHDRVRELLLSSPILKDLKIFQEVNPRYLDDTYEFTGHHYDFYIESLDVIIECHGDQHYKFTNRGNIQYEEAQLQWKLSQKRDSTKKSFALSKGLRYIEIPYSEKDKLTVDKLHELIFGDKNEK